MRKGRELLMTDTLGIVVLMDVSDLLIVFFGMISSGYQQLYILHSSSHLNGKCYLPLSPDSLNTLTLCLL